MKRRFVTTDVFTGTRFGGNPLAVVLDADGLDTARMQAIAREFNYSETTFVLPPADPAHTANVRIFTPVMELPFAGHPNVGTGYVLARLGTAFGRKLGETLLFEEKAGLVPVRILSRAGATTGAQLTAPGKLECGADMQAQLLAECVSLQPGDVVTSAHQPLSASVGLAFLVAELRDRAALSRARPNPSACDAHMTAAQTGGILLYARGDGAAADIHARMFSVRAAIFEDPATGSANAALAALLASLSPLGEDTSRHLAIAQGEDMGRPSKLLTEVDIRGGAIAAVRIGGDCVPVMEGTLEA